MKVKVLNDDMLYNARFWERKFREAADLLESEGEPPVDVSPEMVEVQIEALRSVSEEFRQEADRYEESKRGGEAS